MLLEREELARRIPGDELREQMTGHLRELLTEELAQALERSPARTLTVAGQRPGQTALSLPFELVFGREDPGAIVVRMVVPPHRQPETQEAQADRMVTAFPLTADQHYLPLHLEADLLVKHARNAGLALDELFVCFTGEDVLRAAAGASIVHLAGHGAEGALRCEWRERAATTLTSGDLIEAWREESPRLVVLGFCQSSSERDDLRSARVAARGEMTIEEYAARLASTAQTPSSSMAIDLVSALPMAVIGMRTNADDAEARRFLDAFYAAYLTGGLDIETAYSSALAQYGFVDGVGLPVPALYVGGDPAPSQQEPPREQPDSIRCLPTGVRHIVNTMYGATSSLGPAIGGSWGCRISGSNQELRQMVAHSMLTVATTWREIQGIPGPAPALAINELEGLAIEAVCPPIPRARPIPAARIDLDRWPRSVTMGELLAASSEAEQHELSLLARATCDVPGVMGPVLANGVDALASALTEETGARKAPLSDWELTCELLSLLPEQHAAMVKRWTDERWSAVEEIGQSAIDVVAAFTTLLDGEGLLEDDQPAITAIHMRTGLPMDKPGEILGALVKSGVVSYGTGPLRGELPETLSCDRMTAQRALHHCSQGATEALALVEVERELDRLPSVDTIESLTTPKLARLCELSLICDHPELGTLLEKLARREDGRDTARKLRERRGLDPDADEPTEAREWGAWDALIQAGRFEEAAELIDELKAAGASTAHPLRIEANRLITRLPDPDQEGLLRDARTLERRILAERAAGKESAAQVEVLLVVRQAISSALHRLGRLGESGEVLLQHFQETMRAGARPSACAYAGVHAIRAFCLNGEVERARAVCNVLTPMVAGLAPSSATVLVHSSELELLATEGRRVHAIAAAEELLREIGEWDEPRPDQVRGAFVGLSGAFVGTARGLAILALNQLTGRDPSTLGDDRSLRVAHTWPEMDAEEAVAAADELFSLMPKAMETFGLPRSDLLQGTRTFAEEFLQLSQLPVATRLLGREGERALTARAEAGCPLSKRILEAARTQESKDGDEDAPAPREGQSMYDAAIARDHPRLKDALKPVLPEMFESILTLLPAAFSGSRDARLAWAAMVMDEAEEDRVSPVSFALTAISKGEVQGAWLALRHAEGLRPTMAICVAIEEYCLWRGKGDGPPTPVSEAIAALSRAAWENALDNAPGRAASSRAVHLGLGGAFMSIQNVLTGLNIAHRTDTSLAQIARVKEDEPLTRHVFELLWENPQAQLSLSELTIDTEPQRGDEAFELLGILAGSDDPRVSIRARLSRLTAAAHRKDIAALGPALDDLLQSIEELQSEDPRRIQLLNSATLAALELERNEVAIGCARDILDHPLARDSQQVRFGAFNLLFRGLVADRQLGAAADMLAEAGADLGFLMACAILDAWFPEVYESREATRFAEAMLPLAEAEDPHVASAPLRSVRMKFLERTDGLDAWASVRRAAAAPEEG